MNKLFRLRRIAAFFSAVFLTLGAGTAQAALKALIVDGQNNHDWRATTPVLAEILEEDGLFETDVATSPEAGQPMDSFAPAFADYDVTVLNYTGDPWPENVRTAFVDYVRNGGGVVVFHAANNAFPEWPEFNEIIGLGGWGGRDEKSGPMVRFRDGKMVLDDSPGPGGTHGAQRPFNIEMIDLDHPITKGLPPVWMHAKDELYAKLRGPAKNLRVLATARSLVSNEDEPMLFTVRFGEGRVFHTALGHDPNPMRCVGFRFTLRRGAEWAATGRTTLNEVPANFPGKDRVSLAPRPVSAAEIGAFETGKSRKPLAAVEENIREADADRLRAIEALMLEVVKDADASFEGRQFACQILGRIGSPECVPELAGLLDDETTHDMARYALEMLPHETAGRALRARLETLDGEMLLGIISSVARRGDRAAVPQLGKWIESPDGDLAAASVHALGRIGGEEAARALMNANPPEALDAARRESLLLCADSMREAGEAGAARRIYGALAEAGQPTPIRVAAYKGMIEAGGDGVPAALVEMFKDGDPMVRGAAARFLPSVESDGLIAAMMEAMPSLSPEAQYLAVGALAARGKRDALPVLMQTNADDDGVRSAVLLALGDLGGADEVVVLSEVAANPDAFGDDSGVAFDSLVRLSGEGVDDAIGRAAAASAGEKRAVLLRALAERYAPGAADVLLAYGTDESAVVRGAVFKHGLPHFEGQHIPKLIRLLTEIKDRPERGLALEALRTAAGRSDDPEQRLDHFRAGIQSTPEEIQIELIGLFPGFGGREEYDFLNRMYETASAPVKRALYDAMCEWPDDLPLYRLRSLAKVEPDAAQRMKALEGCLRMIRSKNHSSIRNMLEEIEGLLYASSRRDEMAFVMNALAAHTSLETLEALDRYLEDPVIAAEAREAYKQVIGALSASGLDRDQWKATASNNGGAVSNAFDGNPGTRWDTGQTQRPGQWFVLDLGGAHQIQKIVLDTRGSGGDYPRGYEVYVSMTEGDWMAPAASGEGNGPITEIDIPSVYGRFIRIVQTGSADGLYWSIHELSVEAAAPRENLEAARARLEALRQ